jgi:hypothetical protein
MLIVNTIVFKHNRSQKMKTDTLIYFWSFAILAHINAAAGVYFMAILWICLAAGLLVWSITPSQK